MYDEESLLDDLKSLGELLEGLGRPAFSRWHLEFFPGDSALTSGGEEKTWVIERQFFTETVRLA